MEIIKDIREKAKELVEKRTWVRKAFDDLLEEMNRIVASIPSSDEATIWATLYSEPLEYNYPHERLYDLVLVFGDNTCFDIRTYTTDSCEDESYQYWDNITPSEMGVSLVRKLAEGLPNALSEILAEVEKRLESRTETIVKLEKMIDALRSIG